MEIYQNCVTFNDGMFDFVTDARTREDHRLLLEDSKPLVFGAARDRGIRFFGTRPQVVTLRDGGAGSDDCAVHRARDPDGGMAYLIAQFTPPDLPLPLGVFRAVQAPTYEELNADVRERARSRHGAGDLAALLRGNSAWKVGDQG